MRNRLLVAIAALFTIAGAFMYNEWLTLRDAELCIKGKTSVVANLDELKDVCYLKTVGLEEGVLTIKARDAVITDGDLSWQEEMQMGGALFLLAALVILAVVSGPWFRGK